MRVRVDLQPSGRSVRVEPGTTLLEAVRRAHLPLASACGSEGLCGRCGVRVLSAAAPLPAEGADERLVKERNRIDPTLRLACRISVVSDLEITTPYW